MGSDTQSDEEVPHEPGTGKGCRRGDAGSSNSMIIFRR